VEPPHYISVGANVKSCIITEGGIVNGDVYHSVLFSGVYIGKGSKIADSILMPNVRIGENSIIERAIIAENTIIGDNCYIGYGSALNKDNKLNDPGAEITVIGENTILPSGTKIMNGIMMDADDFQTYQAVV
jgi:glucose-1-phosphate adenylyltransferase